jgi:hypothetical protein
VKTSLLFVCCVGAHTLLGADFVNLTFDLPRLDRVRTDPTLAKYGPVEDLLRGWEVSLRPIFQDWQPYTGEAELAFHEAIYTPVALVSGFALAAMAFRSTNNFHPSAVFLRQTTRLHCHPLKSD